MHSTFFIFLTILVVSSCGGGDKEIIRESSEEIIEREAPESIIELGEMLFFETALSLDNSISCASCHNPEYAFADTVTFSVGVGGKLGKRNAPSVMNMASRSEFFYDGRAETLEDQVHFPIEDPLEMNVKMDEVLARLRGMNHYVEWFKTFYEDGLTKENVAHAIAEYERDLETADTKFDDYMTGDESMLSESEKRGLELFNAERSRCFECHFGPDITGDEFRNIGLFDGITRTDKGRFDQTGDSSDIGKFKVPGLRNVAVTGPYMHDGSFSTLEEVIEYYDNPYAFVENPINMDSLLLEPLNLSDQDKVDLVNFLKALTDRQFEHLIKD